MFLWQEKKFMKTLILGLDLHNFLITENVSMTILGGRIDPNSVPCVLLKSDSQKTNLEIDGNETKDNDNAQ